MTTPLQNEAVPSFEMVLIRNTSVKVKTILLVVK